MPVKKQNCIEFEKVVFGYDSSLVFENISFVVKKGEYLGIVGPNGGGKTTLIKIILGFLKPNSGIVRIMGVENRYFKERHLIGYVPQRISQDVIQFPASVEEVVISGRTPQKGIFRKFKKSDFQIVERVMEVSGIIHQKKKVLSELSGGDLQKVFIARALAGEPKILILDEPTSGVDLVAQETFYRFIANLNKNYGITIILVSHDIAVVAQEVQSLLCINKKLFFHGEPQNLLKEDNLEKLYGKKVKFIFHNH